MRKRILIVGAGFAGMWAALSAARLADKYQQAIDITVIAPQPELRVRPRFYERAVQTPVAPLQPLFDVTGVNFLQGHVEQIIPDSKEVSWKDANGEIHLRRYDRLVLASGSHVNRDAVVGAAEHAFDLDQLESATALEQHITDPHYSRKVILAIRWWSVAAALPGLRWRWNYLVVCVRFWVPMLRPEWS